MKKILFLFAICTVCGCERPQVKDKQTVSKSKTVLKTAFGEEIQEVEFKGHVYLIFAGVNKGNIIHAEHCPCKTSK